MYILYVIHKGDLTDLNRSSYHICKFLPAATLQNFKDQLSVLYLRKKNVIRGC